MPGHHGDVTETGQKHKTGHTTERATEGIGDHQGALRWQPGHARRFGVRAKGIESPAIGQIGQRELKDKNRQECHPHQQAKVNLANRKEIDTRQIKQPGRQRIGGDRFSTRVFDQQGTVDRQGAQRGNNRRHAAIRDNDAIKQAHCRTETNREQQSQHRRQIILVCQLCADKIGRETDNRTNRQIDIARQHDQRLPHRHDDQDHRAGADPVKGAATVIALNLAAKKENRQPDQQHET